MPRNREPSFPDLAAAIARGAISTAPADAAATGEMPDVLPRELLVEFARLDDITGERGEGGWVGNQEAARLVAAGMGEVLTAPTIGAMPVVDADGNPVGASVRVPEEPGRRDTALMPQIPSPDKSGEG